MSRFGMAKFDAGQIWFIFSFLRAILFLRLFDGDIIIFANYFESFPLSRATWYEFVFIAIAFSHLYMKSTRRSKGTFHVMTKEQEVKKATPGRKRKHTNAIRRNCLSLSACTAAEPFDPRQKIFEFNSTENFSIVFLKNRNSSMPPWYTWNFCYLVWLRMTFD